MTITDLKYFFYSRNYIDLKDIVITEQLIEDTIKSAPSHSAAGIDGVPPILNVCIDYMYICLCHFIYYY